VGKVYQRGEVGVHIYRRVRRRTRSTRIKRGRTAEGFFPTGLSEEINFKNVNANNIDSGQGENSTRYLTCPFFE